MVFSGFSAVLKIGMGTRQTCTCPRVPVPIVAAFDSNEKNGRCDFARPPRFTIRSYVSANTRTLFPFSEPPPFVYPAHPAFFVGYQEILINDTVRPCLSQYVPSESLRSRHPTRITHDYALRPYYPSPCFSRSE